MKSYEVKSALMKQDMKTVADASQMGTVADYSDITDNIIPPVPKLILKHIVWCSHICFL